MNLNTSQVNGITVVTLPGRAIDASNAADFKAHAVPLLVAGRKLVFAMGELEFVDSTGLGALVSCLRQIRAVQGEIKLCELTKPVFSLFELVRMHKIFDIYNSVDEAVRSYR